jgi:hypothetical protein
MDMLQQILPILIIDLIILAFATWRISRMLSDVSESGPLGLLHKVRYWAGVRFDANSKPYGTNSFAEGLLCIKCNSIWVGFILSCLMVWFPIWAAVACLPFALSGFVLHMENI